ncbi:CRISPR-associated endonuclease Cas3'' [Streptosporangium sp. NPDC051023]|uniref:CRISPR-associated endonuclease Cas3'' n=1 Tax=Streptosporangium sp. NPDC051023 TaxID=3155410 RepID=UPI00344F1F5C
MHEDHEPPDTVIDHRLWGKHKGLPAPYPVICHLIDTAAIAGALWDIWSEGIPSTQIRGFRRYICFWAGLHDLGKVSPSFQVKVEELYQALITEPSRYGADSPVQGLGHHEVTHWVLVEILRNLGYPRDAGARRDVGHQIAQMLGGHHGRFCQAMDRAELRAPHAARDGLGEGVWEEQRQAHATALRKLTGADEALAERLPAWTAVVVIGIVIVADWLVSQESFISPRIPGPDWVPSDEALRTHWERAVADAPFVIREAGLGRARFRDLGFAELFGFEPNALQKSIVEELPALVRGPGLLLVTAPPGDGKTFSPRRRGCSTSTGSSPGAAAVLPAQAGVFRHLRRQGQPGPGSPPAGGGVPVGTWDTSVTMGFSPRRQGCSEAGASIVPDVPVLPAQAGGQFSRVADTITLWETNRPAAFSLRRQVFRMSSFVLLNTNPTRMRHIIRTEQLG